MTGNNDLDALDELGLMDDVQDRAEQRITEMLPCDPCSEMHSSGDPGRGRIDDPQGDDGWIEPGPNPEEMAFGQTDELISSIDDNWEDELLDL